MARADGATMFGRLLWPEHVPISELERELTATRITHAGASGKISPAQARDRLARLPLAKTRADLNAILDGVPGASAPPGLLAFTRVATVAWVVCSVVQFVVWALICLISGSWDDPWWMWWVLGGGPIVAGLWWTVGRGHGGRMSGGEERSRL